MSLLRGLDADLHAVIGPVRGAVQRVEAVVELHAGEGEEVVGHAHTNGHAGRGQQTCTWRHKKMFKKKFFQTRG